MNASLICMYLFDQKYLIVIYLDILGSLKFIYFFIHKHFLAIYLTNEKSMSQDISKLYNYVKIYNTSK